MPTANEVTQAHINRVAELIGEVNSELTYRAIYHDQSKFDPIEAGPLQEMQDLIDKEGQAPFGTDEYRRRTALLGPMLEHHYAKNRHHPEHECAATEVWRSVVGHEGLYEVSNLGRVRSLTRTVTRAGTRGDLTIQGGIMTAHLTPKGYLRLQLRADGKPHNRLLHTMVAEAFIGPAPSANHQVNHKSGDKTNNRATNLEWATPSENLQHAYDEGLRDGTVKYTFICHELELATLGAVKMAEACIECGYLDVNPAGVYGAAMREGAHRGLTFTAVEYQRPVETYSPIASMTILDVVEMLCDWKAASERGGDSAINLTYLAQKYGIEPMLLSIMQSTCRHRGWAYV
jgi:hypothetical protein